LDYNTIILNREHSRFSASKKLTSKRNKERKKKQASEQARKQLHPMREGVFAKRLLYY
jgi:hypothetical protein